MTISSRALSGQKDQYLLQGRRKTEGLIFRGVGGSSNLVDIIPQLLVFIVLTELPKYGGGTQSPPLALPVPTALFLVHSRFMH